MDGDLQTRSSRDSFFHRKKNVTKASTHVSGWRSEGKRHLAYPPACQPYWRIGPWLNFLESHCMILAIPLKATAERLFQNLPLMGSCHRFIPASGSMVGRARITEDPGTNRRVKPGNQKYGLSRTFRVFLDIPEAQSSLADYSTKPMHFLAFFSGLANRGGMMTGSLRLFRRRLLIKSIHFPTPL